MMHGHSLVLPCYNTCHSDPLGLQVEKTRTETMIVATLSWLRVTAELEEATGPKWLLTDQMFPLLAGTAAGAGIYCVSGRAR